MARLPGTRLSVSGAPGSERGGSRGTSSSAESSTAAFHLFFSSPLKANYDASYTGVLTAADAVDTHRLVDQISVWRRGNHLVHANHLTPDGEPVTD